jgi:hypothetical protein
MPDETELRIDVCRGISEEAPSTAREACHVAIGQMWMWMWMWIKVVTHGPESRYER